MNIDENENTEKKVVVRYAPSPTGLQHVGGARTAMYNWLFARKHNGKFILRIEDTDSKRYNPNAVTELIKAFSWLGIDWDEGPTTEELLELDVPSELAKKFGKAPANISYVQSKRLDVYKKYADELVSRECAYPAFGEEFGEAEIGADKKSIREARAAVRDADLRTWREASAFMVRKAKQTGRPYHIRAKLPREGYVVAFDELREVIVFYWTREADFVLIKSDGGTTYHLASVIDDHEAEVTHVIRGEEWVNSLPKHLWLYEQFGWEAPKFIHTASILNPSGKGKMSKRQAVAKDGKTPVPTYVTQYKELGYSPLPLMNFMALTGWNPGNNIEKMNLPELIELFDIERLSVKGAAWDFNKLNYFNAEYLRSIGNNEFINQLKQYKESV